MTKTEVSIVVPCRNEEATIAKLLDAIGRQTFPLKGIEVIVVDGLSTDGTRHAIRQFSARHSDMSLRLYDNPSQTIPAALNIGISQALGEVIVRLDAHSVPQENYVENCVSTLAQSGAANVGGQWTIRPSGEGWISRSIAIAASHPLGAGDARYRIGGQAGKVETVPFGAYPRTWLDIVGPFNEELHTNEDYEYNLRLRNAGGVIWFDPSIQSTYYARPDLASLLRQYLRYGYWKSQMLRLFPGSIRWRQMISPLFVILLLSLILSGLFQFLGWLALAGTLLFYGVVLVSVGAIQAISRRDLGLIAGIPAALATMHLAWGSGFLWGIIRPRVKRKVKND